MFRNNDRRSIEMMIQKSENKTFHPNRNKYLSLGVIIAGVGLFAGLYNDLPVICSDIHKQFSSKQDTPIIEPRGGDKDTVDNYVPKEITLERDIFEEDNYDQIEIVKPRERRRVRVVEPVETIEEKVNEPITGTILHSMNPNSQLIEIRTVENLRSPEDSCEIYSHFPAVFLRSYYESEKLGSELYCFDGKPHGIERVWHKNGTLVRESNFINGIRNGKRVEWFNDGQIKREETYVNGKLEGIALRWYENGQKIWERNFVKSVLESKLLGWHENGTKSREDTYIAGKLEGVSRGWDNKGETIWLVNFSNGEQVGRRNFGYSTLFIPEEVKVLELDTNPGINSPKYLCRQSDRFHEAILFSCHNNGVQSSRIHCLRGSAYGNQIGWHDNGEKAWETNYGGFGVKEGVDLMWDENGSLIIEREYSRGKLNGKNIRRHPNEQKAFEYVYVDGIAEGQFFGWYPNGQKQAEVEFVNGKRQGKETLWYESSAIMSERYYDRGNLMGKFIGWHENGQMKELRIYNEYGNQKHDGCEWNEDGTIVVPFCIDTEEKCNYRIRTKTNICKYRLEEYLD
jgi:antitoxin component YwqK of YwqJK toxin-antitoxin module